MERPRFAKMSGACVEPWGSIKHVISGSASCITGVGSSALVASGMSVGSSDAGLSRSFDKGRDLSDDADAEVIGVFEVS